MALIGSVRPSRVRIYLFSLCCMAMPVSGATPEEVARRLIEASAQDRITAEGIVAGFRSSMRGSDWSVEDYECFEQKVTPKLVLPVRAKEYLQEFSGEDLRNALTFFESSLGQTYAEYQLIKARRLFGTDAGVLPEFSPTEIETLDEFATTPVGKYMLSRKAMPAKLRAELNAKLMIIGHSCRLRQ